MCGSDNNSNNSSSSPSFPYLRKAANISFETLKILIEKELKHNNLIGLNIPEDYDKSADMNFRKELTLFPDQIIDNSILSTRSQREKHCANIKVVPVEHKLPEINQPVTNKVQVHRHSKSLPGQDNGNSSGGGAGAKVQITQIAPPGIPLDILKSVSLSEEEDKRLVKILSKIPQGESQSYKDYVSLDLPSIMSLMDQQNILMRKLVEQNAIMKKALCKIYDNKDSDNNNKVRSRSQPPPPPPQQQQQRKRQIERQSQSLLHKQQIQQIQQQKQEEPPPPPHPSTMTSSSTQSKPIQIEKQQQQQQLEEEKEEENKPKEIERNEQQIKQETVEVQEEKKEEEETHPQQTVEENESLKMEEDSANSSSSSLFSD